MPLTYAWRWECRRRFEGCLLVRGRSVQQSHKSHNMEWWHAWQCMITRCWNVTMHGWTHANGRQVVAMPCMAGKGWDEKQIRSVILTISTMRQMYVACHKQANHGMHLWWLVPLANNTTSTIKQSSLKRDKHLECQIYPRCSAPNHTSCRLTYHSTTNDAFSSAVLQLLQSWQLPSSYFNANISSRHQVHNHCMPLKVRCALACW